MDEHERTEAEDIVRAIRHGEIDAFVVRESDEDRIYSLRSADVLYRAMIEQMKDGAVALDSTGLIVYCNAYFAQLVKAERTALVGTKILPFVPAERDGDGFFESLGEPARSGATREIELRTTDGTTVPVMAVMNRIAVDRDNHVYCLIVTDLTEQKRREQLLIEGRRKDEFLAMLAHELRNPIAPIRYAAARLRAKDATPEKLRVGAERHRSAGRPPHPPDRRPAGRLAHHAGRVSLQPRDGRDRRGRGARGRGGAAADRGAQAGPDHQPAGQAPARERRSDPPGAGHLQPAEQRRQVHARRRAAGRRCRGRSGGDVVGADRRQRRRCWNRSGGAAGSVQPVRAGRFDAGARARRARHRAHAGPQLRRDARWNGDRQPATG